MENIVSALIGAFASILVCLINNRIVSNKNVIIIQNDLKHLTDEVRKHNGYAEKIEELRLYTELSKVRIEQIDSDIEELKRGR